MDFATFERIAKNTVSEEGVCARFYDRAVKSDTLDKNGLPVFDNVCYVEIRFKDNSAEIFDQPATEDKIKRFPAEYARYQLARKQISEGKPLEQFAFLTAAEIETLKARGIFTVEALAALSGEKAGELDVEKERDLAVKFIELAKGNAVVSEWQKKEEKYLQKISLLEAKIQELSRSRAKKKKE